MVGEVEQVLEALNRAQVRYLVVGGVAVVLHGCLRATADLDLVVHLEPENVVRASRALEALGYRPRPPVALHDLADPKLRENWIRSKGMTVLALWSPGHGQLEIDLFVTEPFEFVPVYERSLRVPLERTEVSLIALDDLIALKRQAGRPQDLADIDSLEALRAAPPDPGDGSNG